jgi:hypothetical protein
MAQAFGQQHDLGPRPDLVQRVDAVMDEVSRIPNMPLAGQGDICSKAFEEMSSGCNKMSSGLSKMSSIFVRSK